MTTLACFCGGTLGPMTGKARVRAVMSESIEAILPRGQGTRDTVSPRAAAYQKRNARL